MSKKRILHLLPMFALVATFIVTACQPIRSQTASPASGEQDIASREELKAKIIAMEFATFDHLRQHDVAAVEAETSADYLWIDATGIKGWADYLAVVADEKLQFGEPERGAVEVRILSPTAVLVMYPMTTHGTYDGEEFTGHEYLSSLWMKRAGKWQNVFLQSSPQEDQESPPAAATVDEQIQNAMSAAPPAIAKDATILDYPAVEGGDMIVLREGTNDWTCFTDWPVTPGNDPACYDAVWMALNDALAAGVEPEITSPGLRYMLAGGNDPSNTDPLALAPAPGEDWITTPAHLMLLVPGGFDASQFTIDHTSGAPFIMWDGTPYEHLMIPVNTGEMEMGHSADHQQTAAPAYQQTAAVQALATKIDALMTNLHAEGTFNGAVLIAHNGQVLLRKGYGLADREQNLPNTPTTRFRLASLTKQFTAMAILLLQEQGKLHTDDGWSLPVTAYRAAYTTAQQHSGNRSARAGIVETVNNVFSYSSASQTVQIPTGVQTATLSLWLYTISTEEPLPSAASADDDAIVQAIADATAPTTPLAGARQYVLTNQQNTVLARLLWTRTNTCS